jgi:hypothetical protein
MKRMTANDEFKKGEKLKPFNTNIGGDDRENEEILEFSTFNRAALIFNRQDRRLTDVDNCLWSGRMYEQYATALKDAHFALRLAIVPVYAALRINDQNTLDRRMNGFIQSISRFDEKNYGPKPSAEASKEYGEMWQKAYEVLQELCAAQQRVNMGVPKERSFTTRQKIRRASK